MINYIRGLLARMKPLNEERRLARALDAAPANSEEKERALNAFINYLGTPAFFWRSYSVRGSVSSGGVFHRCGDIYGEEIAMRNRPPGVPDFRGLIDCSPEHYGLTWEQGQRLFNALCAGEVKR